MRSLLHFSIAPALAGHPQHLLLCITGCGGLVRRRFKTVLVQPHMFSRPRLSSQGVGRDERAEGAAREDQQQEHILQPAAGLDFAAIEFSRRHRHGDGRVFALVCAWRAAADDRAGAGRRRGKKGEYV